MVWSFWCKVIKAYGHWGVTCCGHLFPKEWKAVQSRLQEQCWWWDLSSAGCSSLPGRNRNSGSSVSNVYRFYFVWRGVLDADSSLWLSLGQSVSSPMLSLKGSIQRKVTESFGSSNGIADPANLILRDFPNGIVMAGTAWSLSLSSSLVCLLLHITRHVIITANPSVDWSWGEAWGRTGSSFRRVSADAKPVLSGVYSPPSCVGSTSPALVASIRPNHLGRLVGLPRSGKMLPSRAGEETFPSPWPAMSNLLIFVFPPGSFCCSAITKGRRRK